MGAELYFQIRDNLVEQSTCQLKTMPQFRSPWGEPTVGPEPDEEDHTFYVLGGEVGQILFGEG